MYGRRASKGGYSIRAGKLPQARDIPPARRARTLALSHHPPEEPMESAALKELFIDELKDLYSAENQLIKALPKMAKAANSEELRNGFEEHLEQTKGHAQRIEQIFQSLDDKPTGKTCKAMQGLVAEGAEAIDEDFEGEVSDAALIGAARRVEHYEIAAYSTVIKFAEMLGETQAARLLGETLDEETETDEKLVAMVDQFEVEGATTSSSAEEESDNEKTTPITQKKTRSARA
jgi:ferritin-like metal-binding protein YciE